MIVHGLVSRPTADLDLFSPDKADVRRLQVELTEALIGAGLAVTIELETESFVRLAVGAEQDDRLEVEIAFDARMFPPVELQVGPVPVRA